MKTDAAFQSFEENNIAYREVAIGGSNHRSVINICNNNSVFLLEEQWFTVKSKLVTSKPTEAVEVLLFYVNEMLEKRNLPEKCIVFMVNIYKTMFRGAQCSEEGDSTFPKGKMLAQKSITGIGCPACILNKYVLLQ
jgi:hypothetical protein